MTDAPQAGINDSADHQVTVNDQFKNMSIDKPSHMKRQSTLSAMTQRIFMYFVCTAHKNTNARSRKSVDIELNKPYTNTSNSLVRQPQNDSYNNNTTNTTTTTAPPITVQQSMPPPTQPQQVQPAKSGIDALVTQVQQNVQYPSTLPQLTAQQLTAHINHQPPPTQPLLPPLSPRSAQQQKKCLVLDLDETLVHSSFKPINDADFIMTIELENVLHRVYVRKRPGVDHFLAVVGELFEVIIFTASLAKYADPLLDILDKTGTMKGRLFREACVQHYGNYVKDLSHLGRKLQHCIIIDNSPFSYMFQPDHAIPITSWFNDKTDRQLYELIPFLQQMASPECDDICQMLSKKRFQFA